MEKSNLRGRHTFFFFGGGFFVRALVAAAVRFDAADRVTEARLSTVGSRSFLLLRVLLILFRPINVRERRGKDIETSVAETKHCTLKWVKEAYLVQKALHPRFDQLE